MASYSVNPAAVAKAEIELAAHDLLQRLDAISA